MKFAIIADIHSNAEALQSVLSDCKKNNVESIVCAGDIVGYGPEPSRCIELLKKNKILSVAGNHDWAVAGNITTENFNQYAKEAVLWTKTQIDSNEIKQLCNLELIYENDYFYVAHGDLKSPELFIYLNDLALAVDSFYLMKKNICFVAHTHRPCVFVYHQNKAFFYSHNKFEINQDCKYIINVGSVGQPRDNDPRSCYCIFDIDSNTIEFKRVEYLIETTQLKIYRSGLPAFLAERLSIGQ